MTDKKKTWTGPELIVLVRNKPEEAVLWTCKMINDGYGAAGWNLHCSLETCVLPCNDSVAS